MSYSTRTGTYQVRVRQETRALRWTHCADTLPLFADADAPPHMGMLDVDDKLSSPSSMSTCSVGVRLSFHTNQNHTASILKKSKVTQH